MLEMKTSINQIKTTVDSAINIQDWKEERIWKLEGKIKEALCANREKNE
jgi:hypothetical protein